MRIQPYTVAFRLTPCLAFLILVSLYYDFTMDDAFITYRYSQYLAEGRGLVWNLGEDPVEGYTSFSWVLLNSLAILCRLDPVAVSKVVSIVSALAIIWILVTASKSMHWGLSSILVGAIAASPLFAFLTVQGLETALAALLLLLVSRLSLQIVLDASREQISGWYAAALLAALTRPDTIPISIGVFAGLLGTFLLRRDFSTLRRFLSIGAIFLVLGAGYLAWRVSYFGHLFPNPYYIKMAGDRTAFGPLQAHALHYLRSFFLRFFLPYFILFVFLLWKRPPSRARFLQTTPLLLGCTLFALYLFTIAPIQGYFWRFIFPAFPALLLTAAYWFESYRPEPKGARSNVAFALLALFFLVWNLRFLPETFHEKTFRSTNNRVLVGRTLEGLDGTMFTAASGALPYYSGWRAVDKLGLNSEEIAHNGLSVEIIESINPDLIILRSNAKGIYSRGMSSNRVVNRYMRKHGGFVAIAAVHRSFGFHLFFFGRKDSRIFDEMADRLLHLEGAEYGDLKELMLETGISIHSG